MFARQNFGGRTFDDVSNSETPEFFDVPKGADVAKVRPETRKAIRSFWPLPWPLSGPPGPEAVSRATFSELRLSPNASAGQQQVEAQQPSNTRDR